jgi:hypothetical protein
VLGFGTALGLGGWLVPETGSGKRLMPLAVRMLLIGVAIPTKPRLSPDGIPLRESHFLSVGSRAMAREQWIDFPGNAMGGACESFGFKETPDAIPPGL